MEEFYEVIGVIGLLVIGFLLIPPKYDPAIRIREWLEKNDGRN